jgi:pyridoxamine 5'-phosphate oxidase
VLLRVVPHVERGEAVNAGVVLFCRQLGFLEARVALDERRLRALAPDADVAPIREHLGLLTRVAAGASGAGPIARLEPSERFHWLAAPSSTVIQPSPVHTGLCDDPGAVLDRLVATLVDVPGDLGWMRRSYEAGVLDEASLAPTWLAQFERWFAEAREALEWHEVNAMVVASSAPDARIVLLKGVDADGFVFFTDLSSAKGAQLLADPRAALVFPWHAMERQVRVTGRAERLPDADADAYFASRPRGSQLSAAASHQSSVLTSRADVEQARAELEAALGERPVERPERWGGLRVIPDAVEFWQGRPDRLHDRLRYRRSGDAWVVERLSP